MNFLACRDKMSLNNSKQKFLGNENLMEIFKNLIQFMTPKRKTDLPTSHTKESGGQNLEKICGDCPQNSRDNACTDKNKWTNCG